MSKITAVCFLWKASDPNDRSYTAEHVNVMYSMLKRHLSVPHELVCVTDSPEGIRPEVRCVPLDERLSGEHLEWKRFQKLAFWRRDAAEWLGGDRLLLLDLDQVIVDSIDPLVQRSEPVVMWYKWRTKLKRMVYSSTLVLLDAGSRPEVYETFDPDNLPEHGGDQGWIISALEETPAVWTAKEHGVIDFVKRSTAPQKDSRIVVFSAGRDPATRWEPWIKEYWN